MTEPTLPSPVPTQVKKPWRATVRTLFAALVAVASMAPLVYSAAFQNDPEKATGWSALALGIAAGITRVLAVPAVEAFLQSYLPFLAADSKNG
jgi:hypothetical protein